MRANLIKPIKNGIMFVFYMGLPHFLLPKTKLSGRKTCPKGPDLMESMVPGSRSTSTALGTYFPLEPSLK